MDQINLNGLWAFAYTNIEEIDETRIPAAEEFSAVMPVPGYWDDNRELLKLTKLWSRGMLFNPEYREIEFPLGTGKPADASLPYIIGTGWYRKEVSLDASLEGSQMLFTAGGAVTEFVLFINGKFVYSHRNQMTGSSCPIQNHVKYGAVNEFVMAVSNFNRDIISTAYRGYKGFSAGIYGDVGIRTAEKCLIDEIYAYTNQEMSAVFIETSLIRGVDGPFSVHWKLTNAERMGVKSGVVECSTAECGVVKRGEACSNGEHDVCHILCTCDSEGLIPWDDHHPYLYELSVEVFAGEELCDRKIVPYGLRIAAADGMHILLNNRRILLRGLTEHGYFPLTCTPPNEKQYYRSIVRMYKEIGFNWIRFHTTVPHEYYLEACDELGMLVQVEAPNHFRDEMWKDFFRKCRSHPSVILYCGGNEERLTDEMIGRLEAAAKLQKEYAPDALFSPMEALPYVDWVLEEKGAAIAEKPIPHNPVKLNWLRQFSDVFQPQKDIGFNQMESEWQVLEPLVEFYGKPYLSHEVGICDGFIDLDLENRYIGTRIGTSLYTGAREYLEKAGLQNNAPVYYRNSCLWSAAIRKIYMEKLRLCGNVSGYDYLGAIDCHWHRTGYTPGILNEFHEYKPGESREDILRYNGESVILLDLSVNRNFKCGETVECGVFSSIYGREEIRDAVLSWKLMAEEGDCLAGDRKVIGTVETGRKKKLGNLRLTIPLVNTGCRCVLKIRLESACCEIDNQYSVWMYPEEIVKPDDIRISHAADSSILDEINQGLSVLFLSPKGLKTTPLSYTKMMAGRTVGNTSTVIYDHPITAHFPHQGWCDLQFYPLFENAESAVFDQGCPLEFEPLIEIVSSYKMILKQSCLFECCIGKGKAVVCTLNLEGTDPGKTALLNSIIKYMNSGRFQPKQRLSAEQAKVFFHTEGQMNLDYSQETGLDGNAQGAGR